MSDLISRSKLLKRLEEWNTSDETDKALYNFTLSRIIEQPTAYDINRVVKELEKRTDFLKDCTKYGNKNAEQQEGSYNTMMMYEVADLVDDLIEIVKQGGVSDDVCEWRLCDEEANVYDTSCRNPHILIEGTPRENNYKHCPYCGKKIKVVEQMNCDYIDIRCSDISCDLCEKIQMQAYNKAIDDFVK